MQERKSLYAVEEALEDGGGERCSFEGNVSSNKSPPESRSTFGSLQIKARPLARVEEPGCCSTPSACPLPRLSGPVCSGSRAWGRADMARSNKNSKLPDQ